jgi:hypothetical protein
MPNLAHMVYGMSSILPHDGESPTPLAVGVGFMGVSGPSGTSVGT